MNTLLTSWFSSRWFGVAQLCAVTLGLLVGGGVTPAGAAWPSGEGPGVYADIETERGTVTAELFFEKAPLTAMNFIGLAEGTLLTTEGAPMGKPFFDGLKFHRVVPDFVVQGGDPRGDGEGGPGYQFPDEFAPGLRHNGAGVLSMANDGPDTNGSQFFVTLRETNRLNYLHSVFGQVVRGTDMLGSIAPGDTIRRVTIRRIGAAAEAFQATPERFAELREATLRARRAGAPAGFVYFKDETKGLPEFRAKNFNFKLANYERATGHRLLVRLLEGNVTVSQARKATKAMAGELDLADDGDGALACLFVGAETWKLRLGEGTFPALIGEGGPASGRVRGLLELHERKSALTAPAQELLVEGKLKESCDAMIDGLILRLDDFALRGEKGAASGGAR